MQRGFGAWMEDTEHREFKLIKPMVTVAVVMLALMTLYEGLKQFLIPDISIWGSHFMTIVFTTVLAVVTFYNILKHYYREYDKHLEEIALRRAAEARLRRSEAKWQGLVDNAMVGVYQVSPDGRFLMVNDKLAVLFGFDHRKQFLEQIENISQLYMRSEERPAIIDQLSSNGFIDRIEVEFKDRQGDPVWVLLCARAYRGPEEEWVYEGFMIDMTARKRMEAQKARLVDDLKKSISQVKMLSGMLPICANCKKIRDDQGYWKQVETYIQSHSEAKFSHSCCPECAKELYPQFYKGDPSQ
jgi:PAS domain S-box-containing protein